MKKNLHDHLKKFSSNIWFYIICLFIVSRIVYALVGGLSVKVFDNTHPTNIPNPAFHPNISDHRFINLWYSWDAGHYTVLAHNYNFSLSKLPPTAQQGSLHGYHQLSWFPLYPITAKVLYELTHISLPYAQLIISNLSFVVALYVLYKLVRLDEDEDFARKSLLFLVLMPVSFLFSSGLSESLFLLLAITTFYFARRGWWLRAAAMGALLALTRSTGFLIAIPLLFEVINQLGTPKPKQWRNYARPIVALGGPLIGLAAFMLYCWVRTGDLFAYNHSQLVGWGTSLHDPLAYLVHHLNRLSELIILAELAVVIAAWRKLRLSYIVYSVTYILMSVSIGEFSNSSSLRYASITFPVAIAAAYLARNKTLNDLTIIAMALANSALFILWANWWTVYIV